MTGRSDGGNRQRVYGISGDVLWAFSGKMKSKKYRKQMYPYSFFSFPSLSFSLSLSLLSIFLFFLFFLFSIRGTETPYNSIERDALDRKKRVIFFVHTHDVPFFFFKIQSFSNCIHRNLAKKVTQLEKLCFSEEAKNWFLELHNRTIQSNTLLILSMYICSHTIKTKIIAHSITRIRESNIIPFYWPNCKDQQIKFL